VKFFLDAVSFGSCGSGPGMNCSFQDLEFIPEPGFVPWLGDLAVGELGFAAGVSKDNGSFGEGVAALGDVNGDGVPDLAVGAPAASPFFFPDGRVTVRSGRNPAAVLATYTGAALQLGYSVASLGDLDGDGIDDLAAGSPGSGTLKPRVTVWSGATGAELFFQEAQFTSRYGEAVTGFGDVDLDGVPDVLAGAPGGIGVGNLFGTVRVLSGASGATLHEWHGPKFRSHYGAALAALGDVNGDGVPDALIGAPDPEDSSGPDLGHVHLVSGANGASLGSLAGDADHDLFGTAVAGLGDVNGDGTPDFAVSAPEVGNSEGLVRAYSGATLAQLWALAGAPQQALGEQRSLAALGDTSGDGVCDLLLGTWRVGAGGSLRVLDGATGAALMTREHDVPGGRFGFSVSGGPDMSGDGWPDIVVSAPKDDLSPPGGPGKVFLLSSRPADYGAPQLVGGGLTVAGQPFSLQVVGGAPGSACYFLVGLSRLDLPFKGGVLVPSPDLLLAGLLLDGAGSLTLGGPWPAGIPAGFEIWMQAWFPAPAAMHGFTATNSVLCVAG
jgi:hypothetical protein